MIHWDADRYAEQLSKRPTGQNEREEERLDARFPPDPAVKGELLTEPAVLVDAHNRILAWYLPHALSTHRQVSGISSFVSRLLTAVQKALPVGICVSPQLCFAWNRRQR